MKFLKRFRWFQIKVYEGEAIVPFYLPYRACYMSRSYYCVHVLVVIPALFVWAFYMALKRFTTDCIQIIRTWEPK